MSAATYPAERVVDVVLRDGSTVHVRPVREGDEPELERFLRGLSAESRAFRFFSLGVDLHAAAVAAVTVDYVDAYGVIGLAGPEQRIIGHACYVGSGGNRAEVAFATADELQGHGLATILLAHLAEAAATAGIATFTATVLPANHQMLKVFRDSGFTVRIRSEPGEVSVEFPVDLSEAAIERFAQRDQVAAAAAVEAVLRPRSVALIGASRRPGSIGAALAANLSAGSFHGPVYLINSRAGTADEPALHASLLDLEGSVDLAVIAVPAAAVTGVARDCAQKQVRALVVISAGFGEEGEEGRRRQAELLEVCRATGMRLVGPNCLGVLNASPAVSLNATFAPSFPPAGNVGVMAQSGGVAIALIERARELELGISSLVSVGDKADLSGNDFLQYWEQDEETAAIVLYLESFGNPRKFARVARRVGARKPILAVKSGRGRAGGRAAGSHTGALLAASDVTVDALFRQAGVIRAETLGELLDTTSLLANQPLPAGPSVAVVTNGGGPGILCADALEAASLQVPELAPETRERLAAFLPPGAALANPVDMIASATGEQYRRTVEAVVADPAIDAVIALFVPPVVTTADEAAAGIVAGVRGGTRELPVAAVFLTAGAPPPALADARPRIPVYGLPEDASRALARAYEYAAWLHRPRGRVPVFTGIRREEAAALISECLSAGGGWLAPEQVAALCACYGIPLATAGVASTAAEAGRVAARLGGEVALKAVAPTLIHKSDAGGVRVGLRGEARVARAARKMRADVERAGHGKCTFLVQKMASGVELLIGVVHDPHFGPVLACGAGGVTAELTKDVAVRLTPLSDLDARDAVRSLRMFPLLDGYRDSPRVDMDALELLLLRISELVESHPQVAELELNPAVVSPAGVIAVDARVRITDAVPGPPTPSVGS
jgi:acyl-CoA synthetase (NDP forming)/GNAT superfamily N-acetyltransferase